MAMLHDAAVRESLLARMKSLRADTPRHWGSMSIDQMCWHLADGLEMALGKRPYGTVKLPPLPKSVIKFAVLNLPWPRGAPTIDTLRATSRHDFEAERSRCLRLLDEMGRRDLAATWPAHPAFGAVDGTFHSRLQAKHVEHHLRQFGA
jgi:hypothetical protein